MDLFHSGSEEPKSKILRYVVSAAAFIVLVSWGIWFFTRYRTEEHTVEQFLDALIDGNSQRAYQIWHPHRGFEFQDFLSFWGPNGLYSPMKSYRIESAAPPRRGGSGIIVTVEFSPYAPFPDDSDAAKSRFNREVSIWVERSDQSLSFPPP